jgi:hypothetical protein
MSFVADKIKELTEDKMYQLAGKNRQALTLYLHLKDLSDKHGLDLTHSSKERIYIIKEKALDPITGLEDPTKDTSFDKKYKFSATNNEFSVTSKEKLTLITNIDVPVMNLQRIEWGKTPYAVFGYNANYLEDENIRNLVDRVAENIMDIELPVKEETKIVKSPET